MLLFCFYLEPYFYRMVRLLFSSLFITAALCSFSQERVKPKIIAGLMGAQIDGDQLAGYNKPGLVLGGAMELPLGKRIGTQLEMMYCQKGARSTSQSLYYSVVRLSYIDISGAVNIYLGSRWVLQPGFSYAVLFRARADAALGFVDVKDIFNSSDKCFLVGAEFKLAPKTNLNLRYGYSLATIRPDANWYNNTLSFTLRFLLGGSE